jgi:glycerophosphoryl diester phosphodiesterase
LNHDLNTPKGPIRLNKFADLNRPALEDLLALIQGKKLSVMLETKMARPGDKDYVEPSYVVAKIDSLIRKYNVASQIILQSFDHQTLIEMHKIHPGIRLCLLNPRTRLDNYVAPAKAIGAQIQFINFRIIEKQDVDALHAAGLKVFSGTTSDPADWKKLIELKVDGILTDDPLGLQKLLAAKTY